MSISLSRTAGLFALLAMVMCAGRVYAQDAPLSVIVDDRVYVVTGTVVATKAGDQASDSQVAEKARFTAHVLDTEILKSDDNRTIYSAPNRASVFADALSKDWIEPWSLPLVKAASAPGAGVADMVAEAQALADAKRAFVAWIARLADNPRELAITIARRDYLDGVRAFRENSAIYRKVTVKNGILTYEEALRFQKNQIAVLRMAYARALEEQLRSDTASAGQTKDGGAAHSDASKAQTGDQSKDEHKRDGDQSTQAGQDEKTLKEKLNAEASKVDQVKSVAELESKFDDMRKIVESDASGLQQTRELKEYMKSTAELRGFDGSTTAGTGAPRVRLEAPQPTPPSPGSAPVIDFRHVQSLIKSYSKVYATPAPRYRVNPVVIAQAHRPIVWPKGYHPRRQSDITGLDRERVSARYQPVTRAQAQNVVAKYRSIPGGITLEGSSSDLAFIKSVTYLSEPNAFILNNDVVYLNPVTADEFLQIARALAADDKMGVSIGSISIVYGELSPHGTVARNLKLADSFLGGIAFGDAKRSRGYIYAPGYQAVGSITGANGAVYFNVHGYRFHEDPSGELRRDGLSLDVMLVPLSNQKASDGGYSPDFDRIEKGDIPAPFVANVKHLQNNVDYYGRERIVRTTFAYGEIAAFARALKENGVRMGSQAR